MAQQPSCEPTPLGPATLRVLMCENFHHSCRSDGSSVELMPGIEQDERANPNQFISAVIKPILTMVHRRHEATSVALSSVSWAEGMARASGRPVVDLGSSKCDLLLPTGAPAALEFTHVKAPPLTEPLVAVKAKDYGISPDEVDLARAQYERIVPFLVRCWVEKATLVATEGVRAAATTAGLPLDGLTAHALLSSAASPVGAHYARDSAVLEPLMRECKITVLSSSQETILEFQDAAARHGLPLTPPAGEKVLFLSMGGGSTQVVCVDAAGETHDASFKCGKNYFRHDAAARRACVEESERLVAFVEARMA